MLYNILSFYLLVNLVCVKCNIGAPEGTPCSVDGVRGTCVNVFRCLSSMDDLKKNIYPPICSYQGTEPVVCCTDCDIVEKRYRVRNPYGGIMTKTGQKSWDKCLDYLDTLPYECKIYNVFSFDREFNSSRGCYEVVFEMTAAAGGSNAYRGQFPHMALLGYGRYVDTANWLCGGTVISDRFILTAGHCIASAFYGPVKYAAFGILKRSDPPQFWNNYKIKQVITHPEYRPPVKYHDIALLETIIRINFDKFTLPACLPVPTSGQIADGTASATGWGAMGLQGLADTMQLVNLHKFTYEECSSRYPRHRLMRSGFDTNTQLCYGDRHVIGDTCEGDSGGPLQISGQTSRCQHTVIGVTSTGRDCWRLGSAGIYTRVIHYVPWIESIVWP